MLSLPADLTGFDLAVATYGVLNWIADVDAWICSAASTLRAGGRLVFVEFHPLFTMVGSVDPLVFDWPYTNVGPQHEDESGS